MVIVTPTSAFPLAVTFFTCTDGVNDGFLLTEVFVGGWRNVTTDVYETGPMSLNPPTRVVPPPLLTTNIVAALAVAGASHDARRLAAAANIEEPDCGMLVGGGGQKLRSDVGGRMTGLSPWCRCRILAFGSVIVQTPTLIEGENVSPLGSVLRSNRTPAGVSLANSETNSW